MTTSTQHRNTAINLVTQAAELLEAIGDVGSAMRLRQSLAIIRSDGQYPESDDELKVPLSLMQMALALMDRGGWDSSSASCALQEAIDHARGAQPLQPGEKLDPALCPPFDLDDGPQSAG